MKVIVVEDEGLVRNDLMNIINSCSKNIEIVGSFSNGVDVINYIKDNDVDLLFLDINIPMIDGMTLAKTISKFEKKPYIIFITAHKEYAIEAFEIKAFDYILKPYTEERIISIVNKVYEEINKKSNTQDRVSNYNKLTIKDNEGLQVLDEKDIYYLKSDDKTTYVRTKDSSYKINNCISDVERDINNINFFRCHRSYVVNINKINSIENSGSTSYKLRLNDIEDEVHVSRRKIKELKEAMNIKTL